MIQIVILDIEVLIADLAAVEDQDGNKLLILTCLAQVKRAQVAGFYMAAQSEPVVKNIIYLGHMTHLLLAQII